MVHVRDHTNDRHPRAGAAAAARLHASSERRSRRTEKTVGKGAIDDDHLWAFDITGGRYEEREYVATGSGSLYAGTVIKVGYRRDLERGDAINLACRALWEAADADSATGGPDSLRGIYPIVATIDAGGFVRVPDEELAERYAAIADEVKAR